MDNKLKIEAIRIALNAAIDNLQRDLEWIEKNSTAIEGECAALRESWANVRAGLAKIAASTWAKK